MKLIKVTFLAILALVAITFGAVVTNAAPQLSQLRMSPSVGNVYSLQVGSTIWGMGQAIAEKPMTLIYINSAKDMLMFGWRCDNAWCFTVLDTGAGKLAVNTFLTEIRQGQVFNGADVKGLLEYMRSKGWAPTTAAAVPEAIKLALSSSAGALVSAASAWPTFVLLPIYQEDGMPAGTVQYPTPVTQ
jgi:hypothetical protein